MNNQKISEHIERTYHNLSVSGVIASGSFKVEEGTIFCDVVDKSRSIVVELEDEEYNKLVIEVENPNETIKMLTNNKFI